MPSRKYGVGGVYRYGFNGKENDNEIKGSDKQYDYGFRIYDPRLGRFQSVDPLTYSYPYYTPYQFAGNMPIAAIDLDGLEQYVVIYYKDQNNKTTKIQVRAIFDNDDMKTPLNQHVHEIGTTEDIAKGNVLVFEIKKMKDGKEIMSVVENRNIADGKLTKQEAQIFKKTKANLEVENGSQQILTYGTDKPNKDLYQSDPFFNEDTKTYTAEFGIAPKKSTSGPEVIEKKKEKTVMEVEVYTVDPAGANKSGTGNDMHPVDWAKSYIKAWEVELKKQYKGVDTFIVRPNVHYSQKFPDPATQDKIVPVKTYTVPVK